MNNKHVHPTIAAALNPFFSVGIKTKTRELGCRIQSHDGQSAMVEALQKVRIPADDMPTAGLEMSVRVTQ